MRTVAVGIVHSLVWTKKKVTSTECQLETIKKEDMMLLELIPGVHDPKLWEEFLRQKDPILINLVALTERWQMASDVQRDMGIDYVSAQTTSTYKAGKNARWQQQELQDCHQSLDTCTYCGGRGYRNHACKHSSARDVECHEFGKIGHYKRVCKSKG